MPDEPGPEEPTPDARPDVALSTIAKEWGRIGCTGFGGPPTHIAMLRRLTVERREWIDETEFEDAIAATNILPGPASTQLAIFCAWRLRGVRGALVGGACFICPGLAAIIALAAVFLATAPPIGITGAALGAGAAVAAVAVNAALGLLPASWRRAGGHPGRRARWVVFALAGGVAAATVGTFLVLVLIACGLVEAAIYGPAAATGATAGADRGAARRRGRRRAGRPGLGRAQGRCVVLRGRVRDHPAHAGRRGAPLPLDDEQPVPQRGGARSDHTGSRRADHRRRRVRGGGRGRGTARRPHRLRAVVRRSSSPAPGTSARCGPIAWLSPSWVAPARPPSGPSPARPSLSHWL